jgi:hypothetical protein
MLKRPSREFQNPKNLERKLLAATNLTSSKLADELSNTLINYETM